MNKHAKTLLLFCALGILVIVVILQRTKQNIDTNPSNVSTTITQEENDSSSFIEGLRNRDYEPSQITVESTLSSNGAYTGYLISYISDGLIIYGRMNVPVGNMPVGGFPVIILNHGYFSASSFTSGDGTQTMADILARNGYLTLASDYRGFGKSENDGQGSRGHRPEYAIDVLNLIASVPNLDKANASKIGMWGHSMGGEVTLRSVEVTDKLTALVLWAPTSARVSDNAGFYGSRRAPTGSSSNSDMDSASPINYLHYISTPISLHQGLADTEVNPEWSKELNEALQKDGKSVEYFEYTGQDHNFRNLGWDVISKRTINFFNQYLK